LRWASEGVDDIDGVGEKDVVASLARGISERGSEVRLAKAREAEENDVALSSMNCRRKRSLDLETIDFSLASRNGNFRGS
jgi:hypothetical protein